MINNRQNGRRRGRGGGGPRGQNLGGQPGNRQDNRQRGNAAQLLEKYKSMARDAQLAGDRVQTEYYLQYADHYFRVLSESRSRFEDQNPRRQRDDDLDDEDGDEEMLDASDDQDDRSERGDRQERNDRQDRGERQASNDRQDRGERPDRGNRQDRAERPARRERPRVSRDDRGDDGNSDAPARLNGNGGIADVLPPAIGADSAPSLTTEDEVAPRPRRRARPARPPEDDEVAPAA
ncbi:MAG TPA: DUF4167 domain-containing protein [Sphingomicrobium sp.]|nr:DUF4167 domain-containing protein [Sphingomicrobium sp.]